jgi:hypothetical protein
MRGNLFLQENPFLFPPFFLSFYKYMRSPCEIHSSPLSSPLIFMDDQPLPVMLLVLLLLLLLLLFAVLCPPLPALACWAFDLIRGGGIGTDPGVGIRRFQLLSRWS